MSSIIDNPSRPDPRRAPAWTHGEPPPHEDWDRETKRLCRRAIFADLLKERLWRGVSYHEWEEALLLAGFKHGEDGPTFDARPIERLLRAYRSSYSLADGEAIEGERVAPWTAADRQLIWVERFAANRPRRVRNAMARRRALPRNTIHLVERPAGA